MLHQERLGRDRLIHPLQTFVSLVHLLRRS